ncbi:MAG: divalent-cation tolerance protein CutA [Halofilum sp. (in: g-proteobacteria)]|nr:divalent-cation tolerance protein CutA [Halofilum sp. (in: g-proteobacteria)]
MNESAPQLLVWSTVDDADSARRLADGVVGAGLAACVNILPPVTSVFRWEPGEGDAAAAAVQAEQEVLLLIKTSSAAYPALERHLRAEHPYELPEIIAVPITQGLDAFRQWIDDTTQGG